MHGREPSFFLAGKSDSTTAFSQNVVVTENRHAGQERA